MFTTHPLFADVNGNYFAYMKTMDTFIKDNPDVPIFNVSYEETKQVSNYDSLATTAQVLVLPENIKYVLVRQGRARFGARLLLQSY